MFHTYQCDCIISIVKAAKTMQIHKQKCKQLKMGMVVQMGKNALQDIKKISALSLQGALLAEQLNGETQGDRGRPTEKFPLETSVTFMHNNLMSWLMWKVTLAW